VYLSIYLCICLSIHQSIHSSLHQSFYQWINPSVRPSECLSIHPTVWCENPVDPGPPVYHFHKHYKFCIAHLKTFCSLATNQNPPEPHCSLIHKQVHYSEKSQQTYQLTRNKNLRKDLFLINLVLWNVVWSLYGRSTRLHPHRTTMIWTVVRPLYGRSARFHPHRTTLKWTVVRPLYGRSARLHPHKTTLIWTVVWPLYGRSARRQYTDPDKSTPFLQT
jgi:hypothetical protein